MVNTECFPELASSYACDLVIINVLLLQSHPDPKVQHLTLNEAKRLIREIHPKAAILTHFGMTMLRAKPCQLEERLSEETGCRVIAARDGMTVQLNELLGS